MCEGDGTNVGAIPDPLSPTGRWDLWHCDGCTSAWATPLVVPSGYYDAIYGAARPITGYVRYRRLAQTVQSQASPLDYLTTQQDVYWAAREFLRSHAPTGALAEIGSGLGYLTHAIHEEGREILGLDLSTEAVDQATARFGPHYRACDLDHLDDDLVGRFDAVITLEVIEHAIDPIAFVQSAVQLLRPGGKLLVTTPDRDGYDPADRWRTDPPPVHLHWFGRRSMEVVAERLGLGLELIDFTRYNDEHVQARPAPSQELPTPFLDAQLRPAATAGLREQAIDLLDRVPRLSAPLRRAVRGANGPRRQGAGSAALAAVFTT